MMALSHVLHRLLSPAGSEDRDRRLEEAQVAKDSARRSVETACARLAQQGAIIHALAAGVVERNEEAKEQ